MSFSVYLRWILTALLILAVFSETGYWTAAAICLLYMRIEVELFRKGK